MDKLMEFAPHDKIEFDYINWEGVKGHRKTEIEGLYYGSTVHHKEEQWLLKGFDLDKQDYRIYALKDMKNVKMLDS